MKELENLFRVEEPDEGFLGALLRDGENGLCQWALIRIEEADHFGEGLEGGQSLITSSGQVVRMGLEIIQESEDEQTLFVNETGKYRVWKVSVNARGLDISRSSDQAKVLLDNLPVYPDNLMRGLNGKIWLGFAKPRNPDLDKMAAKPFIRKVILRLPRSLWPVPKTYGQVFAFTEDGKVVADLQDPSGAYPETTGVTETADRLYIQSLHAKGLGWLPK